MEREKPEKMVVVRRWQSTDAQTQIWVVRGDTAYKALSSPSRL